ncbi:hypothetical protein NFI96_001242 [Prochilodus magdalenae]|nr:hypothetical protein NFI96_001242 [Prochilodus magdalenae]
MQSNPDEWIPSSERTGAWSQFSQGGTRPAGVRVVRATGRHETAVRKLDAIILLSLIRVVLEQRESSESGTGRFSGPCCPIQWVVSLLRQIVLKGTGERTMPTTPSMLGGGAPGGHENLSRWSREVKKMKSSVLARASPRHTLGPAEHTHTQILMSVPRSKYLIHAAPGPIISGWVCHTQHRSSSGAVDSPRENGRKASFLQNCPFSSRKFSGLNVSGYFQWSLSVKMAVKLGTTSVPWHDKQKQLICPKKPSYEILILALLRASYEDFGNRYTDPNPTGPNSTGLNPTGPNPTGPNTTGPNPTGPNPTGPNPSGPNPTGPNPSGPNPTGPNPTGPNPTGPNPTGPNPTGPNPTGLNPTGPNPTGLNPTGPNPTGPNPTGPNPTGPNPTGPNPTGPNPTGPNPTGPNPSGPNPLGPNPTGLNPTGPNPTGPNPSGPNPTGLNPTGPNPSGPNPTGLNPTGPNPTGPNSSGPNPSGSNPTGPNPTGPNPTGPNPTGPNPSGPNPTGPNPLGPNP